MGYKIIVNGASGMVGEGVVLRCIASSVVDQVLILGRRPSGIVHPKVRELLIPDFRQAESFSTELGGYDAMLYCAGVSSVGMAEDRYREITYDTTLAFAKVLVEQNPDISFQYISGAHTDSTEQGKSMWARVKGKTENDLMKLPFRQVLGVRPGYLHPVPGSQHAYKIYRYLGWLYPILKALIPSQVSTLAELGDAMIAAIAHAPQRAVLEVVDIKRLAKM